MKLKLLKRQRYILTNGILDEQYQKQEQDYSQNYAYVRKSRAYRFQNGCYRHLTTLAVCY